MVANMKHAYNMYSTKLCKKCDEELIVRLNNLNVFLRAIQRKNGSLSYKRTVRNINAFIRRGKKKGENTFE